MASLVVDDGFDLTSLCEHIDRALPAYARPLFLRLSQSIETTGTFKYRKADLVAAGFDPGRTKCPTYFRSPDKGFVKVTKAVLDKLNDGAYKL
jgi:fatty-acyl-CoA synthase